jgi:hypothetical protein
MVTSTALYEPQRPSKRPKEKAINFFGGILLGLAVVAVLGMVLVLLAVKWINIRMSEESGCEFNLDAVGCKL